MAATSQETDNPAGDKGALPESKEPQEPQTAEALLNALTESRAKKREAAERADKAEAELAALKKQVESKKQTEKVDDPSHLQELTKTVAELRAAEHRRGLARELGLDDKQAEVVMAVMAKNPDLNTAEALLLASQRDKKAFESRTVDAAHPSMHGSLGTSRGAQPAPPADDRKERLAHLDHLKKTDSVEYEKYRNNQIGAAAAAVMGIKHQQIPIPKK